MPSIEALHLSEEMRAFYDAYYLTAPHSTAYAAFCERVFGRNFTQHGFADMAAVDFLIHCGDLDPTQRVLELGCGTGGIAAYLAERTGACVTGIDYVSAAIVRAQQRATDRPERLRFVVANMGALPFAGGAFDAVVGIDALYFTDIDRTLTAVNDLVAPGGQLLAYWSQGADPFVPVEQFDRSTLAPDRTDLGAALQRLGCAFEAWDVTDADVLHARLKLSVLDELSATFAAENTLMLLENRRGEACGVLAAHAAGCHVRYLYRWRPPKSESMR